MRAILRVAVLCVVLVAPGVAGTINFDTGVLGAPVGGTYWSSLGVTFYNAIFVSNFGMPGTSGPLAIASQSSDEATGFPYIFGFDDRIVVSFSSPQPNVSIVAVDTGFAGTRIDAYTTSSGGSVVDYDEVFGVGPGVGNYSTLSVSYPGIQRIELYQPNSVGNVSDGIVLDDLNFGVPEPATLSLIGLGLLAFGLAQRRFKRA